MQLFAQGYLGTGGWSLLGLYDEGIYILNVFYGGGL